MALRLSTTTSAEDLGVGATIQRIEDNETRKVEAVERDENGRITAIVLANVGGLMVDPVVISAADLNDWVVL